MKDLGLDIAFMGGRQAGSIGLLTALATRNNVLGAVVYDDTIGMVAEEMDIPTYSSIKEDGFLEEVKESDILLSVHGREIVPKEYLDIPPLGCVNLHPCLYKYKGANPIGRLLEDGNSKASVAAHYMAEEVDTGEVIIEEFVDVEGKESVEKVYNELYPYYSVVVMRALEQVKRKQNE